MSWLVGRTGYSFFDYWTLAHFSFWFFVGSTLANFKKLSRTFGFIICICLAFWWEVFERFAEKNWPSIWQSPESWWNAWCSDLLMTTAVLVAFWGYDKWRPK